MTVIQRRTRKLSAGVAAASLLLAASPALAQSVGKAAAVNPSATGSAGRTLTLGAEVVHKERITTTGSGSVQLLFIDRTTLNIGPNSDVVIDEYVFDPKTNTGKMSVSLGKGLMRFVGGQISHDGNATVKTPTALIGIRGAIGYFSYNPGTKTTTASNDCQNCVLTLTTPGGQQVTIPPGNTATIGLNGQVTIAPTTPQQAAQDLAATTSKSGQTGGRGGGTGDNWNSGGFAGGTDTPGGPGPNGGNGPGGSGPGGSGPNNDWVMKDLTQTLQTTSGDKAAEDKAKSPPPPPPPYPPPPPPYPPPPPPYGYTAPPLGAPGGSTLGVPPGLPRGR